MTRRLCIASAFLFAGSNLFARPVRGARYQASRSGGRSGSKRAEATGHSENAPVIFEVAAEERWPIRGLDPVLHIGDVAIDSVQFANAENTVLRFTCHEPSKLKDGASAFVQYGGDTTSRTDLPEFRWSNVRND